MTRADRDPPLTRQAVPTVDLILAVRSGDRLAAEELFSRHLPRVRQIVALRMGKRLRDFVEIDDIAQDVLLKAHRDLDRFEARSDSAFRDWLATSVRCQLADLARKLDARKHGGGRQREALLSTALAGKEPSPSQLARVHELEERIEAALLELEAHQRELFVLRRLCEMPYADIATRLGITEVNARQAFSRVQGRLRTLLDSERGST